MNSRLHVLDAFRGICAICVIIHHGAEEALPLAYSAVDFFFLLSGFVLGRRHGAELAAGVGRLHFATRRIVRLYPLYVAGSLMGVIPLLFMAITGMENWGLKPFLLSVLLFPLFLPTPTAVWLGIFPLNPPAWSLFFELFANGLLLFVGWRLRISLLIVAASAPLLLLAMYNWEEAGGFNIHNFAGGFPRVLFSFFLGVILWRVHMHFQNIRFGYWPLLLMPLTVLLYSTTFGHEQIFFAALVFVIQPSILFVAAGCATPELLLPAFKWLGNISYGLYVLHAPIQMYTEFVVRTAMDVPLFGPSATSLTVLLTLAITFPLAHLLTYRLDMPIQKRAAGRLARMFGAGGGASRADGARADGAKDKERAARPSGHAAPGTAVQSADLVQQPARMEPWE